MRAYPGSQAGRPNALYGTWDFPTGHYTPQMDWSFIYWDPNKISPYNDKQGAYVYVDDRGTRSARTRRGRCRCRRTSRSRRPGHGGVARVRLDHVAP